MAERIAFELLQKLGFREPQYHPDWQACVDLAQDVIDKHMDIMKEVARSLQ